MVTTLINTYPHARSLPDALPICLDVTGLKVQAPLASLALENAALNGCANRLEVAVGDVAEPPAGFAAGRFDHVLLNPPYLDPASVRAPALELRRIATVEGGAALEDWLARALALLHQIGREHV